LTPAYLRRWCWGISGFVTRGFVTRDEQICNDFAFGKCSLVSKLGLWGIDEE
jgi:hypothetical protein